MYKLSKTKFSQFDRTRGDKKQIFRTLIASMTAAVSHVVTPLGTLFVCHLTLTAILNASALFLVILTAILIMNAVLVAVLEKLILVYIKVNICLLLRLEQR